MESYILYTHIAKSYNIIHQKCDYISYMKQIYFPLFFFLSVLNYFSQLKELLKLIFISHILNHILL